MSKSALRSHFRHILSHMSVGERLAHSQAIVRHILSLDIWTKASTLFAFIPLETEADIRPLIDQALVEGKTVALPRCVLENQLVFHRIAADYDGGLVEGPFALREPPECWPVVDALSVPGPLLILVPGYAYTAQGHRLGKGKGYYDRLLDQAALQSISLGICFECQIVPWLPMETHDRMVDAVVTEQHLY